MTHLNSLERYVGSLGSKVILDIGVGRGDFLLECAQKGYIISGVEINPEKVATIHSRAKQLGVSIDVQQGTAERLPFQDSFFDFVNASELIEHVEEPMAVLQEMRRVLKSGGRAYVSVHNRFGLLDHHFRLYFLNWMPRSWAEKYIQLRGRSKEYHRRSGVQRISEMHYFTYAAFVKLAQVCGFSVEDMRERKIRGKGFRMLLMPLYWWIVRPFLINTFHVLLRKV